MQSAAQQPRGKLEQETYDFCPKDMVLLSEPKTDNRMLCFAHSILGLMMLNCVERIAPVYCPEKWPPLSVDFERFPELRKYEPGKKKQKKKKKSSDANHGGDAAPKQARLDHSYEHVFELPSLLTPGLCTHLIEQSESMQYSSIEAEYDAGYRETVCAQHWMRKSRFILYLFCLYSFVCLFVFIYCSQC
jgi:hypothetical protein